MRSVLITGLLFFVSVIDARPPSVFTKDMALAQSLKQQTQAAASSFNPNIQLPRYTDHPSQTQYYQNITQATDKGLTVDANTNQSQAKQAIIKSFDQRPVFTVSQQSDAIQKGKLIEADAGNIARGISDKYVNCHQASVCHTTNETKVCNEATRRITQQCLKTPHVTIHHQIKNATHCRHLITTDYDASAPKGGAYVGLWYPCVYAGYYRFCKKLYLIPGANHGRCIVSAVSVMGYTASANAASVTLPAGFPITLRIQDHGGVNGLYGTDVNTAEAFMSTGSSVHLAYRATNTAKSITALSNDTHARLRVQVWNSDHYSGPQIGLATIEIPSQMSTKKTAVTWQEDCHAP